MANDDEPGSVLDPSLADQTLADRDRVASARDQTAAEADQSASTRDQQASDPLTSASNASTHDLTRDQRTHAGRGRRLASAARAKTATARDAAACERDLNASERDREAAARERDLARSAKKDGAGGNWITELHQRAAASRKQAAHDRVQAARDRERAARDREAAARERELLLARLATAETDSLTGAHTRSVGLEHLAEAITHARVRARPLATIYVDIVGLKRVNDTLNHAAGDALLVYLVATIRTQLRADDLIIRLGGDEFLCVMTGSDADTARRRFAGVLSALAAGELDCQVRFAIHELAPSDTVATLVARADVDLHSSPAR